MSMIAFVDTETLGLHPDRHAIWEVALVLYDPDADEVTDCHEWQPTLTDEELAQGDPIGMEIGRFAQRRLKPEGQTPKYDMVREFIELTDGAHLAGAVVSFDEERLRRLADRLYLRHCWHYHLIDVEAVAVGALAARGVAPSLPWKSDALGEALGVGIDEEDRHTAMGDAMWALQMYRAAVAAEGDDR